MTASEKPVWCLQVTFCDEENNGFVILGGAGWKTQAELEAAWNDIPEAPGGWSNPDCLCVDKLDLGDDILMERPITASIAEFLLGKPIKELIEEARAKTCFTWGEYKKSLEAIQADT